MFSFWRWLFYPISIMKKLHTNFSSISLINFKLVCARTKTSNTFKFWVNTYIFTIYLTRILFRYMNIIYKVNYCSFNSCNQRSRLLVVVSWFLIEFLVFVKFVCILCYQNVSAWSIQKSLQLVICCLSAISYDRALQVSMKLKKPSILIGNVPGSWSEEIIS